MARTHRATNYRYRLSGANPDQQRQFVEGQFRGIPKRVTMTNYNINLPDLLTAPVSITVSGKTKRPCDRVGTSLFVAMTQLIYKINIETLDLDERVLPIDNSYPWKIIDSLEFVLPPHLVMDDIDMLDSDSLEAPFGYYYRTSELSDSIASMVVEKEYSVYQIDAEQLSEFSIFSDSLNKLTRKMIRIRVK